MFVSFNLLPLVLLFVFFFVTSSFSITLGFLTLFFLVLFILGIVFGIHIIKKRFKKVNWNNQDKQAMMKRDFVCMKLGHPLVFNSPSYYLTHNTSTDEAGSVHTDPVWNTPNKIEFSARICDDGIYIGKSDEKVVWNYWSDISEIFESMRYYGLVRKGSGCIVFDKFAFVGTDGWKMKAYIEAKRRSENVRLIDYMDVQEEKAHLDQKSETLLTAPEGSGEVVR